MEPNKGAAMAAKKGENMTYWRIDYYKTRNWIHAKYIKDKHAQGAIRKARVKHIVDVREITEKEYEAAMSSEGGRKDGRKG